MYKRQVTVPGAAFALSLARRMPAALPVSATSVARAALGTDTVPRYSPRLPAGGRSRAGLTTAPANVPADRARAVFFPACIGAMFGTVHGEGPSVSEAFLMLCERAGVDVQVPEGITSACCGTPWKSKGMLEGYEVMRTRVLSGLWEASEEGRLPIVCDAASCTEGIQVMRDTVKTAATCDPK